MLIEVQRGVGDQVLIGEVIACLGARSSAAEGWGAASNLARAAPSYATRWLPEARAAFFAIKNWFGAAATAAVPVWPTLSSST